MNLVALPTHREGFPNTVLEAGAVAKPVITTWATGARDSVQDGVTGFLVPVGDSASLAAAILRLIEQPQLAQQMGAAAYARVQCEFRQELVWKALAHEFFAMLESRGLPVPQSMHLVDNIAVTSPVKLA
jgi:glycosyltransferase involved in cell wall biosynthesis